MPLTDGVGLGDTAFAEICDHSLFTCQSVTMKEYCGSIGVL